MGAEHTDEQSAAQAENFLLDKLTCRYHHGRTMHSATDEARGEAIALAYWFWNEAEGDPWQITAGVSADTMTTPPNEREDRGE